MKSEESKKEKTAKPRKTAETKESAAPQKAPAAKKPTADKSLSELSVFNQDGKEVGKLNVKGELAKEEVRPHVIHLAMKQELANRRFGTHSTKVRSEVSGSGRKPWKQKGTGRARSGSLRSPLWRHGGVIFGPHPRSHGFSLPRQVRHLAIRSTFRNLINSDKLIILDKLEISEAKTKHLATILKNLNAESALILFKTLDKKLQRAGRNLPHAKLLSIAQLNVHDLLKFKKIFLTKETFAALEAVIS